MSKQRSWILAAAVVLCAASLAQAAIADGVVETPEDTGCG